MQKAAALLLLLYNQSDAKLWQYQLVKFAKHILVPLVALKVSTMKYTHSEIIAQCNWKLYGHCNTLNHYQYLRVFLLREIGLAFCNSFPNVTKEETSSSTCHTGSANQWPFTGLSQPIRMQSVRPAHRFIFHMCLAQCILIGCCSVGLIMAESENGAAAKRLKTDAENDCGDAGEPSSDSLLSDFEISRILRDCAREKNIFIHGKVRVWEREKSLWEIR